MGQVLHGSATTTHAVRAAIQRSKAPIAEIAERFGVNRKTVMKWRKRSTVQDAAMGPKDPRSTVLTPAEEAIAVAFRRHTLLPLDDCLYALQAQNGLSDARAEFHIRDRLSWMRFLGLGLADPTPDANTIGKFREALKKADAIAALFERFEVQLRGAGFLPMAGQLVDATIVAAPKQRMTDGEKAAVKRGETPDAWREKPAKAAQKGERRTPLVREKPRTTPGGR